MAATKPENGEYNLQHSTIHQRFLWWHYLPPTWPTSNSSTLEEGSCTDVLPVPEAVDTFDVLGIMVVERTRNM